MELKALVNLYTLSDDLMGLKRTMKKLQQVVKTRPEWKYRLALATAHFLRCSGRIEPGLKTVEKALETLDQTHGDWAAIATTHINLLSLADRHSDALQVGTGYLQKATELRAPTVGLELALARCLGEMGQYSEAQNRYETALSLLNQRGVEGVLLGYCYEVGARIALCKGDNQAFLERVTQCSQLYRIDINPILTAKYDALIREAEKRNLELSEGFSKMTRQRNDNRGEDRFIEQLQVIATASQLPLEFYQKILTALVERVRATGGLLYLNTAGGIRRICATEGLETPDFLDREVYNYYTTEIEIEDTIATSTAFDGEQTEDSRLLTTSHGDRLLPFLLEYPSDGGFSACGVAVLAMNQNSDPLRELSPIRDVARFLAERQDVVSTLLA